MGELTASLQAKVLNTFNQRMQMNKQAIEKAKEDFSVTHFLAK